MNTTLRLSSSPIGRALLHALCALQRPATAGWHCKGILRELCPSGIVATDAVSLAMFRPAAGFALSLAVMLGSTSPALGQGTYLSAPDGDPIRALIVNTTGNIGIGTESPMNRLTILQALGSDDYLLAQHNYQMEIRSGLGSRFSRSMGIGLLDNGKGVIQVKESDVGYNDLLLNPVNGNVGIGTPIPHALLEIFGGDLRLGCTAFGRNGNGGIRFTDNESNPTTKIYPDVNNSLKVDMVGRASALVINSGGYVGIGTVSPQAKLHIDGSNGDHFMFSQQGHSTWNGGAYEDNTFRINEASVAPRFVIQAGGNIGIGTEMPQAALDVAGKVRCTVIELASDRNVKAGFEPVSPRVILQKVTALPLSTWHYTNAVGVRHIGPVAQDFHAAFGVGSDDKHIASVDADGVALAAIQALVQELSEKDARIAALEKEVSSLRTDFSARLTGLEKAVAQQGKLAQSTGQAGTRRAGLESLAASRLQE